MNSIMNELDLRKELSNKTVDVLVDIIIKLSRHIVELEMELSIDNESNKTFVSVIDELVTKHDNI